MPTLLGADGRPLQSTRPASTVTSTDLVAAFTGSRSQWTDRDPWGDGNGALVSYETIYRSQPVISAVVDKLTRRISTLPIGAFTEDAETGSRSPLESSNGLQTLLRRPLPGWSGVHLLAHISQSLLINANALVAKRRSTGRDGPVDELWPLDWSKVAAYAPDGGRIEWWSTTQFGGVERFIHADEVVHFAWPGPDGGQVGVSPLEKLAVTIKLEDAAQRHQVASFRNGNRPSLTVSVPGDLKPDQIAIFRESIDRLHKGVDNAGKTLLLTNGATTETLSLTPVEAALIDQRKLSREEVGMVYDLAGPLMNDLTHGTYSNVEELNRGLYRDVIPPWTSLIVETLEAQLVDKEERWLGSLIRFDFSDKLRGDPVEQANALKALTEAGLISRDEARKELGRPPVGGAAAELSANLNNQALVADMAGGDTPPPDPTAERSTQQ